MSTFEDSYQKAFSLMGQAHGTQASAAYAQDVNAAINSAFDAIKSEALRVKNVRVEISKGNVAEAYHAETFNVSAVAKGQTTVTAEMMVNNKTGQDIRYGQIGVDERIAELKYYASGEKTAKALNNPGYSSGDKVVPADQLEEVQRVAARESMRNATSRPEVAETYAHTAENSSDRLEYGNVSSRPLSNSEAIELTNELQSSDTVNLESHGLAIENFVEWTDIGREAGQAALNAAAFSAALTAAPHLTKVILRGMQTGEIDVDTLRQGASAVATSASQVGLRAAIAAAIVGSCKAGYCGEVMKQVSPHAIGMATALVINAISYSIKSAKGEMPGNEVALNCIRDSIALSSGMLGAYLGSTVIPFPIMGALIGNIIGSTIGAMAFQGIHSVTLGVCVEYGWTMFGIVDQNYQISEEVLEECGFDLIQVGKVAVPRIEINQIHIPRLEVEVVDVTFLRRGVIRVSSVGYL